MNEQVADKDYPTPGLPPTFDPERLDVYCLELQFITWASPRSAPHSAPRAADCLELQFITWASQLFEALSHARKSRIGEVCDQFDRASFSALLNTAEGNDKRRRQVRAYCRFRF